MPEYNTPPQRVGRREGERDIQSRRHYTPFNADSDLIGECRRAITFLRRLYRRSIKRNVRCEWILRRLYELAMIEAEIIAARKEAQK